MFFNQNKINIPARDNALPGREMPIQTAETHYILGRKLKAPFPDQMEIAVFGLGCFWGAERKFWSQDGIWVSSVGYTAGFTLNPTYEEVCSGLTGHNEVVQVVFDPEKISYLKLLKIFFESHNPTQGMRQGNDLGTQYRSGIYFCSKEQESSASSVKSTYTEALIAKGLSVVTTEIIPLDQYYFAEDYHQQYLAKNPNGYCGLGGTGVQCQLGV
ncbi:MAG: peptide-methionine (S)-S-oxide reductase MsrA [Paracoccaceae bacterium]|nr:peptide-methionine (S)-S-oxide reductase MsrA [Paracoccaceae bacterium]